MTARRNLKSAGLRYAAAALLAGLALTGVPGTAGSAVADSAVSSRVTVTNFDHNAGSSPTIGGDGAAQIAIGAKSQSGSPANLQQLTTNAGGPAPGADGGIDPNIVAVTVQTAEGPQVIQIQRPDNFGPTIFGEKFFTVMVSYN